MTSNRIHGQTGSIRVYPSFDRFGLVSEKRDKEEGNGAIPLKVAPLILEIRTGWRIYLSTNGKAYSLQQFINGEWVERMVSVSGDDLIYCIRLKVGKIDGVTYSLVEQLPAL